VIEHSPTGHAFQQAYPQANPYEAIRSRGPGQVVKRTWLGKTPLEYPGKSHGLIRA
jgi:hypothetical protein